MSVKIELEEIRLLSDGGYEAIVRAAHYEDAEHSEEIFGATITGKQLRRTGTTAEFNIRVSQIARRKRKRERTIEDIKLAADRVVLARCEEIVATLKAQAKAADAV